MYNATINLRRLSIITAAAMSLALASCGNKENENVAKARDLFDQATGAVNAGQYNRAVSLLDSIDRAYPDALEIRKQGMSLRPRAIEGALKADIAAADSTISSNEAIIAELQGKMNLFTNDAVRESYYHPVKSQGSGFGTKSGETGIAVRVSNPSGGLYLVSSVNPGKIAQRSITITADDGSFATTDTIASDSQANFVDRNSELLEFQPRQCSRLTDFLIEKAGQPLVATIVGDKGTKTVKIDATMSTAFGEAARLSRAITTCSTTAVERERLIRNLETAQKQQSE